MKKWMCFSLVVCIVALGNISPSVYAQDGSVPPLTQTITLQSNVGQMSMQFPFGWRAGNPYDVEETYIEVDNGIDSTPTTAVIEVIIAPFDTLKFEFDTRAENPAEAYFLAFRRERQQERFGVYGQVIPALFGPSLDPYNGAMMMMLERSGTSVYLPDDRVISMGVGVTVADDTLLVLSFQCLLEDFEGWRNTWLAMLDTLKWNDTPLMNTTNRQRTANLEDSMTMDATYSTLFPDNAIGDVSTLAVPVTISPLNHSFSVFPPSNWQHTTNDGISDPILLSPIGSTTAFAAVRWIPVGNSYGGLVIRDESLTTARLLLGNALAQEIQANLRGGVTEVTTFDWSGYATAAVAYQFDSGVPNIRFLVAIPEDGFIEITLQALPTEWVHIGFDFDNILTSLRVDSVLLDSKAAREARQELSVQ